MAHLKKKTVTRHEDEHGKRCTSKTPGATKVVTHSAKFYGIYRDSKKNMS